MATASAIATYIKFAEFSNTRELKNIRDAKYDLVNILSQASAPSDIPEDIAVRIMSKIRSNDWSVCKVNTLADFLRMFKKQNIATRVMMTTDLHKLPSRCGLARDNAVAFYNARNPANKIERDPGSFQLVGSGFNERRLCVYGSTDNGTTKVYVKATRGRGGSQAKQVRDVLEYIAAVRGDHSDKHLVLIDGDTMMRKLHTILAMAEGTNVRISTPWYDYGL